MQNETMSEPKSVQPISVLLLPSPALLFAQAIAEAEAKAPRLRAQQRGRVAKGKKGRFRAALRHLWDKVSPFGVCRPRLRPHKSREADSAALARTGERESQSRGVVPQMSPTQKAR